MEWLNTYIKTLRLGNGGYGIVVSQNMVIMTYPEQDALGRQLQELGGPFGEISRRLRQGEEITALQYDDSGGGRVIAFFRRMFNGWYVGLITPAWAYYRDLYYAAFILSILGFVLACALTYLLLRISAARMKSDEKNKSKSSFLARMSHEIRTPMNAIIGMSELTLREELGRQAREYVGSIKQAGNNLLSIINDILDFSKIESGKLDIIPADYLFSSLINDVISIIRTRINEKPVTFVTKIDGSLPDKLYGDEVRLRQILLNILSNAIKYTKEGHIILTVYGEEYDGQEQKITLCFEAADTGIGIKPEDMKKLFGDFIQFDAKQNRGIEGTGLGLAITRSLCVLMGGDITAQSEYGKGSVFTVRIPQDIRDRTPFAAVTAPETKSVLVFENRRICAESIAYTLDNLGAGCSLAQSREEFLELLTSRSYQYVFTPSMLFGAAQQILTEHNSDAVLVLLAEYGESARPGIHTLFMPIQPVAAANILNGNPVDKGYHEIESPGIRFTAPGAHILIVDDIATNLDVAAGLLAPYRMNIDRAAGGPEAINLVQKNQYDLILMDHMMPGMDGIEATLAIRSLEGGHYKTLPIVALTANAVSGMREMFLEKGFNDYISKPIEIAKLDEVIGKWIPPEKRIKTKAERETFTGETGMAIPGVDVRKGINMTGGTEAAYRKVLAQFYRDAEGRLPLFAKPPLETELADFAAQAHALKSAAGTIGAAEVSKEAAALEAAGKAGDTAVIAEKLSAFYTLLSELVKAIGKETAEEPFAASKLESTDTKEKNRDVLALKEKYASLKAALEAKNMEEIDSLLGELEKMPLDAEERGKIDAVSDLVLMGEYEGAIENITTMFFPLPFPGSG
jgi:signal transduction histidine kinase/CheY-like chemotaxis protein